MEEDVISAATPELAKQATEESPVEKERPSIYSPIKGRMSFIERKIAKLNGDQPTLEKLEVLPPKMS